MVRFGKSARAEEVWQDVLGGIRRNVSVGYMIHKATLVESNEGVETYRVNDWEPFEVSLVSVPADASVGVGRSAQPAAEQKDLTVQVTVWQTEPESTEASDDTPEEAAGPAEKTLTQPLSQKAIMTDIITPEVRNHAAEISKVAAAFPGTGELALSAIQRGLTVE